MASRDSLLRACTVLTASLSFAALAHAQTAVAGRVIHRAKQTPVPNVAVELLGVRDTVLATGISTQDGAFVLEAPAGGAYRVRLTAPGAEAFVSDSIRVADDEYATRAFAIDPEPRAFSSTRWTARWSRLPGARDTPTTCGSAASPDVCSCNLSSTRLGEPTCRRFVSSRRVTRNSLRPCVLDCPRCASDQRSVTY